MDRAMAKSERFKLPSAVHLFLLRQGQVLLLRRFNTGYEDGNYSVVAGHLDGGETVRAAMIREAREEVGIEIAPAELDVVGVMHRRSDDERIDFFLAATAWTGQVVNCEPQRCDELRWAPLDDLPPNVIPYVRRALQNWRRGIWFEDFGWGGEKASFALRPLEPAERNWVGEFIAARWGSPQLVTRGRVYDARDLPGFVAVRGEERLGLVLYRLDGAECEIVSLDSAQPALGIGTALVAAVREAARRAGCRRLWLITTNDNLRALRFYQKRGFRLVAVHADALTVSRQLKPEIPAIGLDGIPLRDEIELEMAL